MIFLAHWVLSFLACPIRLKKLLTWKNSVSRQSYIPSFPFNSFWARRYPHRNSAGSGFLAPILDFWQLFGTIQSCIKNPWKSTKFNENHQKTNDKSTEIMFFCGFTHQPRGWLSCFCFMLLETLEKHCISFASTKLFAAKNIFRRKNRSRKKNSWKNIDRLFCRPKICPDKHFHAFWRCDFFSHPSTPTSRASDI